MQPLGPALKPAIMQRRCRTQRRSCNLFALWRLFRLRFQILRQRLRLRCEALRGATGPIARRAPSILLLKSCLREVRFGKVLLPEIGLGRSLGRRINNAKHFQSGRL